MSRRKTLEVFVGNIGIGANNPIRIQSMTTTNTRDIENTISQIKLLADTGCDIVRCTVQGMKESLACEVIKDKLIQENYNIPLVADIHFFPEAALHVIDFVDKVRINPGNFADKKRINSSLNVFSTEEKNFDQLFSQHLNKIENKLAPLLEKCKKQNKTIRIGVNHGSLSERIMQKYGNTVEGMVESAIEYMLICHKFDFHNLVFSMKSSNPQIMIMAYRNLCKKIDALKFSYPMHLGVTEAGSGLDGRVKSSIGIGALLLEGIGDTIRVSLTESPENEILPCKHLIELTDLKKVENKETTFNYIPDKDLKDSSLSKKETILGIELNNNDLRNPKLKEIIEKFFSQKNNYNLILISEELSKSPLFSFIKQHNYPYLIKNASNTLTIHSDNFFLEENIFSQESHVILEGLNSNRVANIKSIFFHKTRIKNYQNIPFLIYFNYTSSLEKTVILSSSELGSLLNDNVDDGFIISSTQISLEEKINLSLSILQGTRKRMTKTEFISCPTCGRTLFNLPLVSEKIKKRISHIPGLKIAIMGCIVNGPGEMADADFGFVGSKPGKIDLYVKHNRVKSHIDMEKAEDALIDLLKEYNVWKEPTPTSLSKQEKIVK